MTAFLNIETTGPVAVLTMEQPARRNALSGNTAVDELVAACDRIERDAAVRVVILTGRDPAFSSGGDLGAMREDWKDRKPGAAVRQQLRNGVQRLSLAFHTLQVPTIAAVNGPAIGGGCDLACLCDIRIASDKARFAANFVKLGIVPAIGGAWLLTRILGASRAAEMCLTGDMLDAQAALACGLVSQVVPHQRLMEQARALATRIAAHSGPALRMTKGLLRAADRTDFPTWLDMAAGMQALALQTDEHETAVKAFEQRVRDAKE
jgi:enoyl-CoA hydratase/carnithine racemase